MWMPRAFVVLSCKTAVSSVLWLAVRVGFLFSSTHPIQVTSKFMCIAMLSIFYFWQVWMLYHLIRFNFVISILAVIFKYIFVGAYAEGRQSAG
jgi:hypothetical protein